MYFYLLVARFQISFADAHAAVSLLKEEFKAETRGIAPLGILYATPEPIPEDLWGTLGIVEYV